MISSDTKAPQNIRGAFYNTLEEFSQHWDSIDIICTHFSGASKEIHLFKNVRFHPSPWPKWLQWLWIMIKGRYLFSLRSFDIITVQEFAPFYNGFGAWLLWLFIRIPYVLEIHHIPGYPRAGSIKEWFYKKLAYLFLRFDALHARAVRVVNQHETPHFLMSAGVPKEKIVYVPSLYIDLDIFHPYDVEKKYDLVFAARLEKNKGIAILLQAVERIKKQKQDISLLIIGHGSMKYDIEQFVLHHDLRRNVHFSGWLESAEDVAKAYASAHIFVNPSFNEGGPRVLVEAMACGVAVLTTRVGIAHDIIHDGENGVLIDWSARDIAHKVIALLRDGTLREKMATRGINTAQQFERVTMIEHYATSLKNLISE
jgi:glycosyltransferase involved in cell wall biosynthesis